MRGPGQRDIREAIGRLKSFRDNDLSILSVIACGKEAIPELRNMLFEREPSGLYQARCRAVKALEGLGAFDVLIEFLEIERTICDPVERVGEDAVINAAALAIADVREQHVFELLMRLAKRSGLTGVIAALGRFGRVEAIPVLVNALEEDTSRLSAETALRKIGEPARAALLRTVSRSQPSGEREGESSARRRRSALKLLAEMGVSRDAWPSIRPLIYEADAKIALLACEICLNHAANQDHSSCVRRLIDLLASEDWMLRQEIEACLIAHFDSTREVIEYYLSTLPPSSGDHAMADRIETSLRRVIENAE